MLSTPKLIWNHPANKGHRITMLWRWFTWNLWRRFSRRPKDLEFCGYRFRAYPDCPVSCLIRYTSGGLYDYDCMNFLLRFVEQEDVALDIGAHVGSYTLLFARCAIRGQVIGIELTPKTFMRLQENIRRNNLEERMHLINKALGNKSGFLMFTIDSCSSTNHVSTEDEALGKGTIKVPCTTLDELIDELGITRCAFLKIDVEGFEENVIAGGRNFFEQFHPKAILFEANGRSSRYGCDCAIFEILGGLGYRFGFYRHDANICCIIDGKFPAVSPENYYLAFSEQFFDQVCDVCAVINRKADLLF